METGNVCRFFSGGEGRLDIVNFVLETQPQPYTGLSLPSVYRMHLVLHGSGVLHRGEPLPAADGGLRRTDTAALQEGDLFFTLPGVPAAISSGEGLQYLYISFLGRRAGALIDALRIRQRCCLFPGFARTPAAQGLTQMWCGALGVGQELAALRAESTLLYTFSLLGEPLFAPPPPPTGAGEAALLIKTYVDAHYTEPELSLDQVGAACGYHPKYVSAVFKSAYGIGFSDHLNTLRIGRACAMMEHGVTGIKSIALLCGYRDPLYFSKLFRARMGMTPRAYIQKAAEK